MTVSRERHHEDSIQGLPEDLVAKCGSQQSDIGIGNNGLGAPLRNRKSRAGLAVAEAPAGYTLTWRTNRQRQILGPSLGEMTLDLLRVERQALPEPGPSHVLVSIGEQQATIEIYGDLADRLRCATASGD